MWLKCNKLSVNVKKTNYVIFKPRQRIANGDFKGRVSRLCAWANCHVSPFNSIVMETIESTDAENGNNPIVMVTHWNYFCNHFLCVMNLLHANRLLVRRINFRPIQ